jgi:hypothetical protein
MYLFQFSTCFEQPRAHHQENQLYQYNLWYLSLCVSCAGWKVPFRPPIQSPARRDFGSALPFQTRLTQTKPVLPLSNEHGSQVKDQGRRQCCHNKHKKFPYRLTRDVSLLSGYISYLQNMCIPFRYVLSFLLKAPRKVTNV